MNYRNNIDRFIEGKHYFKIEGEELKNFRLTTNQIGSQIGPRVRFLNLWTDRGAARHAKMLGTDEAWDVWEMLEGAYFDGYTRRRNRESAQKARQAKAE